MDQGLAPCEALLDGQSVLPAHCYNASWEVGRLVLAPEYRAGPEVLKRCLFVTLLHLLRTTEIENVFAVCTPVLARLYRRLGCSVIIKEACAGADQSLSLIHGKASTVLLALASNEEEKLLAECELAGLRQREPALELEAS
ncbi:MAG: N-acetyltransferase [Ramlibacter sp.]|nr:N-acetyltransferase [Ramlibacter sp.]